MVKEMNDKIILILDISRIRTLLKEDAKILCFIYHIIRETFPFIDADVLMYTDELRRYVTREAGVFTDYKMECWQIRKMVMMSVFFEMNAEYYRLEKIITKSIEDILNGKMVSNAWVEGYHINKNYVSVLIKREFSKIDKNKRERK
jgi:hypothetical protein